MALQMNHDTRAKLLQLQTDYRGLADNRRKKNGEALIDAGIAELNKHGIVRHPLKAWFLSQKARLHMDRHQYSDAVMVLESYFRTPWTSPHLVYEGDLLDERDAAHEKLSRVVPGGVCEMCDQYCDALTRIDSGQPVCFKCEKEFGPIPTSMIRASRRQIKNLSDKGFELAVGSTLLDVWQVNQILLRRRLGLPDDATATAVVRRKSELFPPDDNYRDELEIQVSGVTFSNADGSSEILLKVVFG